MFQLAYTFVENVELKNDRTTKKHKLIGFLKANKPSLKPQTWLQA